MDSIAQNFTLAGQFATKIAENHSMLSKCIGDLTELVRCYYGRYYRQESRFNCFKLGGALTISAQLSTYVRPEVEIGLFIVCEVDLLDDDCDYLLIGEEKMHLRDFFDYCHQTVQGEIKVENLSPEQKQSYDILYGYYTEFLEAFGS